MRCLSIKQPWLELILNGEKTIEVRTWKTNYRGEIFLHAGKSVDFDALEYFNYTDDWLPTGKLLATATILDCIKFDETSWCTLKEEHLNYNNLDKIKYGWILINIKKITPTPYKGMLGLFDVKTE